MDRVGEETGAALGRVVAALAGGGEARAGQLAMAGAVADAVACRRHLVVQAGTGTGKSLAYLVPAVLSGRRVVVATATKALQNQLADKDLPLLAAHLGRPFTFAVLKGRSNYLCLQKALEAGDGAQAAFEDLGVSADPQAALGALGRELLEIVTWARTSDDGDRDTLDVEPSGRAWGALSVSARDCPGAVRCPMGDTCFAEAARRRAAEADVVVVNHHLYARHLAGASQLLAPHDVLVVDEAHAFEDVVATALGREVGPGRLLALSRAVRGLGAAAAADLDDVAGRLRDLLAGAVGRRLTDPSERELGALLVATRGAVDGALAAARTARSEPESSARATRVVKAAASLAEDLAAIIGLGADEVAWVDGSAGSALIRTAVLDVAGLLTERLWRSGAEAGVRSAVLTSATVPPTLAMRLGLPAARFDAADVGSPFDYAHQSLLYCAAHLPDPRHPDFERAMHAELAALIRAAGGRTLALFTSWRAMRAAADALRPQLPWRLITQDELPKPAALAAFAADNSSCLFATMGFWQGVDVPGPALSLVSVDRIPFPRPDEPLHRTRRERAGAAAFTLVDLPRAATLLAQGVGRLIRSRDDRGVAAVLDRRLARAGYRRELLAALPPMPRTDRRADVEAFLLPPTSLPPMALPPIGLPPIGPPPTGPQ